MSALLPRLIVVIDGAHLEPFEAVLDALEGLDAHVALGPAILLGVGPSASLYLRQCGVQPWLDCATVAGAESLAAIGRIAVRVGAAGVIVDGGCGADAISALHVALGTSKLLVRVRDAEASLLATAVALCAAGADGVVVVGRERVAQLPGILVYQELSDVDEPLHPLAYGRLDAAIARLSDPAAAYAERIKLDEHMDLA